MSIGARTGSQVVGCSVAGDGRLNVNCAAGIDVAGDGDDMVSNGAECGGSTGGEA